MSSHTEAFKACLEILTAEHNKRMDKLELHLRNANNKISELEQSLQFTQNDFDQCKQQLAKDRKR